MKIEYNWHWETFGRNRQTLGEYFVVKLTSFTTLQQYWQTHLNFERKRSILRITTTTTTTSAFCAFDRWGFSLEPIISQLLEQVGGDPDVQGLPFFRRSSWQSRCTRSLCPTPPWRWSTWTICRSILKQVEENFAQLVDLTIFKEPI